MLQSSKYCRLLVAIGHGKMCHRLALLTAGAFASHTADTCRCADAGILQEAMGRREYWRLVDGQGRPPGLMGMWPSRAITFIENHDTGVRNSLERNLQIALCVGQRPPVVFVLTHPIAHSTAVRLVVCECVTDTLPHASCWRARQCELGRYMACCLAADSVWHLFAM